MTGRNNRCSNVWTGKQVFGGPAVVSGLLVETFRTGGASQPVEGNQGTRGHCAPRCLRSSRRAGTEHRPHRIAQHSAAQRSTAQHSAAQRSTSQHRKGRNTSCPPRHCGAHICQPEPWGDILRISRGMACPELGSARRVGRPETAAVLPCVSLSMSGCRGRTLSTAVTRRQLTFMDGLSVLPSPPESIHSLAQRRVPVSEIQTFFSSSVSSDEQWMSTWP
ncbi:hypothetical protein F5883DRAFT_38752 [Diaporthe sp. PMI_573]|nr:hypothetical protein F5883DRAFT_38752 [Diaporthaceae sp. PMI_573]